MGHACRSRYKWKCGVLRCTSIISETVCCFAAHVLFHGRYRNQDGEAVQADSFVLRNRAHHCGPPRPSFCKRYMNVPMDDEKV